MNRLALFVITALFVSIPVTSRAMEQCPAAEKIKEIHHGVFLADSENGEWLGILQGVIPEKTPSLSFERAIAIQEKEASPLKFQHCSYHLGVAEHRTLDMRFLPKAGENFTIKTEGDVWKKEEGPFGLIYSVCDDRDPGKCAFHITIEALRASR